MGEIAEHEEAIEEYGEPPLKGAIIGSTPYKLLHLSPLPVLVVPASG